MTRLLPTLTAIIADGIAASLFRSQDARLAASFVLGSFTSLHDVVHDPADMPVAVAQLNAFTLGGLGYASKADQ